MRQRIGARSIRRSTRIWKRARSRTGWPARPGKSLNAWTCNLHHAIAQVRAIGEHPFRILERRFADTKARYRGLAKNTAPLVTLFAPGNPYPARRALPAMG